MHPLEQGSGKLSDDAAGSRRSGRGDERNIGVGHQLAPDLLPARKHMQHLRRQPASSNTRASRTPPQTAVRGSGLSTTALPTANAGATERIESISGALNGAITPTTPTALRRVKDSLGRVEGRCTTDRNRGSLPTTSVWCQGCTAGGATALKGEECRRQMSRVRLLRPCRPRRHLT
jgi:hypothetical protein